MSEKHQSAVEKVIGKPIAIVTYHGHITVEDTRAVFAQIAGLLVELIQDGRTGENVGAWAGEPVTLGPVQPAHRRITG